MLNTKRSTKSVEGRQKTDRADRTDRGTSRDIDMNRSQIYSSNALNNSNSKLSGERSMGYSDL